ncbi:MAG: hypothetical protein ACYDEQ_12530 [Desulfocucumaceae bacterium]
MDIKIKSALEKAMERAAAFKEIPAEEIEKMEHIPKGRSLAASYLNNKNFDLPAALIGIEAGTEKYVMEGLEDTLLMNISLVADQGDESNLRAMEGILLMKSDKVQITNVLGEMEQLFSYYHQALEQTKEKFKQDFESRSRMGQGQSARGMGQDQMMGFREEWSQMVKQLNARFEAGLADLKDRVKGVS